MWDHLASGQNLCWIWKKNVWQILVSSFSISIPISHLIFINNINQFYLYPGVVAGTITFLNSPVKPFTGPSNGQCPALNNDKFLSGIFA